MPGERVAIPTGVILALPTGYEGQVRARSGLANNFGITLANGVGTIDSDYRDEVKALLINLGNTPYTIKPNDKIAQIVVTPLPKVALVEAESLADATTRSGGFGSTDN
jgi:dUTP pyrophosphatase